MPTSDFRVAVKALLDELTAAGWTPTHPSAEGAAAVKRPDLPTYIDRRDVDGIHWHLVRLRLYSRFLRGRKWTGRSATKTVTLAAALDRAAAWHVLRLGTCEDAERRLADLVAWEKDVLAPAGARLRALDVLPADPRPYEPAYTLTRLVAEEGLVELDEHRRAMGRALKGFAQGCDSRTVAAEPASVVDLAETFAFIRRDDGEVVVRVEPDGTIGLRELETLNAINRQAGRLPTVSGRERTLADPEVLDATVTGARAEAAEAAECAELAERLAAAVERLLAKETNPVRRAVLERAVQITAGETSPSAIAREIGIPPRTARVAWEAVRERLRLALRDLGAA